MLLEYYITTCSVGGRHFCFYRSNTAIGIVFIAKSRLVFLQTYLRITYKIYDLDDDVGGGSGSSLAEHQKQTSSLGSLFKHSTSTTRIFL